MKPHAFRLTIGQDIKKEIMKFAVEHKIKAGVMLSVVGCVSKAVIRMAGATPDHQQIKTYTGDYEVVSLVGTFSEKDCHLHISMSDSEGKTIGGHMKGECIVKTTMEIVVGELIDTEFARKFDAKTLFEELEVII
jgi:uncharacterized protein